MSFEMPRWVWRVGLGAALLAGLLLLRQPLLAAVGRWLVVDDLSPGQTVDLIYVLNGAIDERPFAAARLWRQGVAPKIAIARVESGPAVELGLSRNLTDVALEILAEEGVESDAVTVLERPIVTSTRDEAWSLERYVTSHAIESVAVVTSAVHSRRSRWILERLLDTSETVIYMVPVPHRRFSVDRWWQTEAGLIHVFEEYLKGFYYLYSHRSWEKPEMSSSDEGLLATASGPSRD